MIRTNKNGNRAPATPSMRIKTVLVQFARQLGFDSCRIARCSPPAHADEFGAWLNEGAHGEMGYMQRGEEKRRDPKKILPGAKSIVVLAMNYFTDTGERIPDRFSAAGPSFSGIRFPLSGIFTRPLAARCCAV